MCVRSMEETPHTEEKNKSNKQKRILFLFKLKESKISTAVKFHFVKIKMLTKRSLSFHLVNSTSADLYYIPLNNEKYKIESNYLN